MKQILIRLALTLPVVWLVVSLVFLLIHLVPGDPILQMLGEGATPADMGALRHQYGLDQPLWAQYVHYWSGVLHGDLGSSIRLHDTVAPPDRRALSLHAGVDVDGVGIGAGVGASGRDSGGGAAGALAGPGAFSGEPVRPVGSGAGSGAGADTCLFHYIGLASCLGGQQRRRARRHRLGVPGAAVGGDGRFAGGDSDAHGAHRDAGRTGAGLHPHRAGQGTERDRRRLPARTCPMRWFQLLRWWVCSLARCWPGQL